MKIFMSMVLIRATSKCSFSPFLLYFLSTRGIKSGHKIAFFRANIGIKRHGELSSDNFSLIKGERFTTFDNDQDTWKEGNCAADLRK